MSELDLDKVEKRIGDLDMDVRPLIAELRKLREENARLRAELMCPCSPCARGNHEECKAK